MTHAQELRQHMSELTEEESELALRYSGAEYFDQVDITRMLMAHRAVRAGYYSDYRIDGVLDEAVYIMRRVPA